MHAYTHTTFPRRKTEFHPFAFCYGNMGLQKEDQIACIDAEISRIEDGIVMLVKQRAILKRKRNAFSPAVYLPPELLALIFEFACLPSGNDSDFGGGGGMQGEVLFGLTNLGMGVGMGAVTPLFIGAICTAWRDIAFGTSQLWNTVTLRLNDKHANAQAALLRHWLARAGQRPLSIKVIEDDSNGSEDEFAEDWGIDVTSTAVIDVLATHSRQWHTVDLFLPSTWKASLSRVRRVLPLLTSITLRVAEGSPTLSRVDAFALAPRLRDVTLVGYSMSDVVLPWSQLERVDGEYFSVGECLDTLRLCPSLRRCQFEQLYRGMDPLAAHPVRHEKLESFELVLDTTFELQALFGAMTLPSLAELVLSLPDEEPLLRAVLPLVRRSGCAQSLSRLHLVGVTPPEEELIGCLWELPVLSALLLVNPVTGSGGKLSERFLELMDPRRTRKRGKRWRRREEDGQDEGCKMEEDGGCLVPRLEHLEYQGPIGFSPRALVGFLVNRWHPALSHEPHGKDTVHPSASHICPAPSIPAEDLSLSGARRVLDDAQMPAVVVVQLKSVVLTTTKKIGFESEDANIVQGLLRDGMHLEFVKDPNGDEPGW